MTLVIEKEQDGLTVLEILRNHLHLSGGMIRHIKFLDDGILLGGERVTVRRIVREGEVLSLNTSDISCSAKIKPCELAMNIVYEDSEIVIPDKPPFMPTHPSHGHYDDTVANALAYRYKDEGIPFVFRPVNRLDRNTSGVLIIAKNRISAAALTDSMSKKLIRKKYIAFLDGVLSADKGEIETYIRRTEQSIIVREVCDKEEDADYALTRYCVLARSKGHTAVLAEPITGRTHQLRVHFASLGCPIVGDELYGRVSEDISRHALHAAQVTFPHPKTGERLSVEAPLHQDMTELSKKFFQTDFKDIDNEF